MLQQNKYTVFFAGELFDHKHLAGNLMLAEAIEKISAGRFKCFLPQDMETDGLSPDEIRRMDLEALFECDLALFNFDGGDLDSGTVLEFTVAKALNKPAVLFRSDFRVAGDQLGGGDPWNLMCSGYPATESVTVNAMALYKACEKKLSKMHESIARMLVDKFKSAMQNAANPPSEETIHSLKKSYNLEK
jgi:nucleoside 2-deoxyribosyltransferase